MPIDYLTKTMEKKLSVGKLGTRKFRALRDGIDSEVEAVLVEDTEFMFDDPWGLSMREKLRFLSVSDVNLFLGQWTMYSHVCHASAFSVWPTWIDPRPHVDAIQCLGVTALMVAKAIGKSFDRKKFIDEGILIVDGNS